MIYLIVAGAALLFLLGKGQVSVSAAGVPGGGVTPPPPASASVAPPSVSAPVIQNATGGSLSAVLGNASAPPNYYASGNPGYNVQTRPVAPVKIPTGPVRSGVPFKDFSQISRVYAPANNVRVSRGRVNVPVKTTTNPTGTFNPVIAARPVVVERVGPEVAAAPWTKIQITRKAQL